MAKATKKEEITLVLSAEEANALVCLINEGVGCDGIGSDLLNDLCVQLQCLNIYGDDFYVAESLGGHFDVLSTDEDDEEDEEQGDEDDAYCDECDECDDEDVE